MKDLYRIKPYSTLAWWIAGSFFIFPVVVVAVGATMAFLSMVSILLSMVLPYALMDLLPLLLFPIIGGIIGFCMAVIQRWILRNRLYWAADNWVPWSTIGGAVGAIVLGLFAMVLSPYLYMNLNESYYLFAMPIFITVLAAFQMIALRHAVKQAWLWIISNFVGGLVFAGVIIRSMRVSYYGDDFSIILLSIFAVFALGMITGFTMIFLFEKKLLPMQVEASDPIPDDHIPSVWDNVI